MRRASHQPLGFRVLGGLSALIVGVLLAACQSNEAPPRPRTNAVTAKKDREAPARASAKPPAGETAAKGKPPRELCKGQSPRDGAPSPLTAGRAADGAGVPAPVRYGEGRWTWVNVWAAWCEPCKKEMPMLLAWERKLKKKNGRAVDLVFVSIDDDQRELDRFLEDQPEGGVRASHWVAGEEAQATFFESLGFEDTPKLPVHAFVSPEGKITCVVEGSVEQSDYEAVERLTSGG